jgi:TetR/AcrR family transcriptional repressor of nem operon
MATSVAPLGTDSAGTADRILDVAERLIQTRGYHAFSYADVSEAVGIRKAGVHYHFPSKDDLGRAVAARYRARFAEVLARLDATRKAPAPSCGPTRACTRRCWPTGSARASAACWRPTSSRSGPGPRRGRDFFAEQEAWLARVLAAGRAAGTLAFTGAPVGEAQALLSGLEGALLVARARAAARTTAPADGPLASAPEVREAVRQFAAVAERLIGALERS